MILRAHAVHRNGSARVTLRPGLYGFKGVITSALMLLLVLSGCGEGGPPELQQAADAVADMMKPANLSRSMFVAAYPDGRPSQYVSFLFSTMGTAEWPPAEEWADALEQEQMQAIGQTMWPAGVAAAARAPDPLLGQQLVIGFDDDRGVVIAYAYVDPVEEPVFTREWKLPRVEAAIGVEEIYQANLDLGLSPHSFSSP